MRADEEHTMSERAPLPHDELVETLAGGLRPVRRLPSPALRALIWCAAALGAGLALMPFADLDALHLRMAVPDLRYAALGALLTALTATVAAFQTSVPGRSLRWTLLPLAPAALWLSASGLGCLRTATVPGGAPPDAGGCFAFLIGVSLPLSLALVWMLRRACPLRPNLTAALAGLAAAAAAAVFLVPFHPHDATAADLALHGVAVLLVIGVNGLAGGRLLTRGG